MRSPNGGRRVQVIWALSSDFFRAARNADVLGGYAECVSAAERHDPPARSPDYGRRTRHSVRPDSGGNHGTLVWLGRFDRKKMDFFGANPQVN
jgi:hypothetical protein